MPRRSELAAAGGRNGQGVGGGSSQSGGGREEGGAGRRCPICGKPSQAATRPFCSKRCRDVDLNRWLSGSYVVPGAETEDEGSE
jgi:endogenous inhibitor of DNA gyrase (YacG/DUF329 family)